MTSSDGARPGRGALSERMARTSGNRRLWLALVGMVALCLALPPAAPPAASAASVLVADGDPSHPCTPAGLVQAVADASPGDTVAFACTPTQITFTASPLLGGGVMPVAKRLTIDGAN